MRVESQQREAMKKKVEERKESLKDFVSHRPVTKLEETNLYQAKRKVILTNADVKVLAAQYNRQKKKAKEVMNRSNVKIEGNSVTFRARLDHGAILRQLASQGQFDFNEVPRAEREIEEAFQKEAQTLQKVMN